ncbi:tRNA (N6-isopentenyl adenosine(37)-C2)-methylthiotransferase MiaB, partial [Patescibacteria group bacterium]|nr:tRNA (N6-isopentenyl adenosine(37)-C2)-methylthiotransferase MiaB [Patescibacteria group bacterium]
MKYKIIIYGCQMNKSDSERIAAVLENIGYQPVNKPEQADLIIVNMCSVRQSAVDRVYGLFSKSKIKNQKSKIQIKNKKIILTGCILPTDRKNLENKVDLIFNIKDLPILPKLLSEKGGISLRPQLFSTSQCNNYFSIPPLLTSPVSAYVPIMTGCNNFCAYCVVPYVRGEEISRPAQEIIEEVKKLIKKGYKEIILLGQNVNRYRSPTNYEFNTNIRITNINFAKLLQLINDLPGKFWLRFITSHPKDLSDELIEIMAKSEKITEYLHLPVQSGDDVILQKMNRGYTVKDYKKLIGKIRDKIRMISISTDIIVGFPGETKKEFKQTVKLMKWAKFDMIYIAQYSPRPMTAACQLKDDVIKKEKKRREQILNRILEKTALKNNKKYINKTIEVLIEQTPHHCKFGMGQAKNDFCLGKTKTFKNVKIKDLKGSLRVGRFVKIKIIKATPWGLEG